MFESNRRSFYSAAGLMDLGQDGLSWTREQVAGWVERAGAIISDHPDCGSTIYDELKAWLSRNPGQEAVYVYKNEDVTRLNEIFICGRQRAQALPLWLKLLLGALGIGVTGTVVYALAVPGKKR